MKQEKKDIITKTETSKKPKPIEKATMEQTVNNELSKVELFKIKLKEIMENGKK